MWLSAFFLMTKGELLRTLEVGVNRPDVADLYPKWINQAIRAICQDYSFTFMRHSADVVMDAGSSSTRMPADFKELITDRCSVYVGDGQGGLVPCDVQRESTFRRLLLPDNGVILPANSETFYRGFPVWVDWGSDSVSLATIARTMTALTFTVKYHRYLPELQDLKDDNSLTRNYPEMMKAKLKAVAFEELNDDTAVEFETLYESKLEKAKFHDANTLLKGRVNRMGG